MAHGEGGIVEFTVTLVCDEARVTDDGRHFASIWNGAGRRHRCVS